MPSEFNRDKPPNRAKETNVETLETLNDWLFVLYP
jgi:hypothetical protein